MEYWPYINSFIKSEKWSVFIAIYLLRNLSLQIEENMVDYWRWVNQLVDNDKYLGVSWKMIG